MDEFEVGKQAFLEELRAREESEQRRQSVRSSAIKKLFEKVSPRFSKELYTVTTTLNSLRIDDQVNVVPVISETFEFKGWKLEVDRLAFNHRSIWPTDETVDESKVMEALGRYHSATFQGRIDAKKEQQETTKYWKERQRNAELEARRKKIWEFLDDFARGGWMLWLIGVVFVLSFISSLF